MEIKIGFLKQNADGTITPQDIPASSIDTSTFATKADVDYIKKSLTFSNSFSNEFVVTQNTDGSYSIKLSASVLADILTRLSKVEATLASGGTTTPPPTNSNKPAAPVLIVNTPSVGDLEATSPLGQSEILVSINNGAWSQYGGKGNVGGVHYPAGYFKFKIKSTSTRLESDVVSSPQF